MKRGMPIAFSFLMLVALTACTRRIPPQPFSLVYYDSFDRSDQLLSATVAWSVYLTAGSTFEVLGDKAWPGRGAAGNPTALYYGQMTSENVKVMVDVYVMGGDLQHPTMKILARYDSDYTNTASNGYECGVDGTGAVTLIRNGTPLATGGTVFNFLDTEVYHFAFTQFGNALFCEVQQEGGSRDIVGYTDVNRWANGNYFGLAGGDNTSNYGYFDEFRVYRQ